jgi:hypothetical protein
MKMITRRFSLTLPAELAKPAPPEADAADVDRLLRIVEEWAEEWAEVDADPADGSADLRIFLAVNLLPCFARFRNRKALKGGRPAANRNALSRNYNPGSPISLADSKWLIGEVDRTRRVDTLTTNEACERLKKEHAHRAFVAERQPSTLERLYYEERARAKKKLRAHGAQRFA